MVKRVAFKMHLNPGMKEEYRRRHDEIWPELVAQLKASGISDYSIFLDEETSTLFAFHKLSGESGAQDLGRAAIVQRWWEYMSDIMETNADDSPVSSELEEVFFME